MGLIFHLSGWGMFFVLTDRDVKVQTCHDYDILKQ